MRYFLSHIDSHKTNLYTIHQKWNVTKRIIQGAGFKFLKHIICPILIYCLLALPRYNGGNKGNTLKDGTYGAEMKNNEIVSDLYKKETDKLMYLFPSYITHSMAIAGLKE